MCIIIYIHTQGVERHPFSKSGRWWLYIVNILVHSLLRTCSGVERLDIGSRYVIFKMWSLCEELGISGPKETIASADGKVIESKMMACRRESCVWAGLICLLVLAGGCGGDTAAGGPRGREEQRLSGDQERRLYGDHGGGGGSLLQRARRGVEAHGAAHF